MKDTDLKARTKAFALRIIKLFVSLPKTTEAQILGRQILKSGRSVGAQYREACRSRSNAEFISKMESALQELDETDYWLDLVEAADLCRSPDLKPLRIETQELIAIFIAIINNAKRNRDDG